MASVEGSGGTRHRHELTWSFSSAAAATAALVVVLAGIGLLARNPLPVLIALPLAVSLAHGWDRRPARGAHSDVRIRADEGAVDGRIGYTVGIEAPPGVEWVQTRLSVLGAPSVDAVVSPRAARGLRGWIPVLHSGPQEFLAVDFRMATTGSIQLSSPVGAHRLRRTIAPDYVPIDTVALPAHLTGMTGAHESRRPGDGGEFRDVHPFSPGDRMRRIDWKATARHARGGFDLFVRRSNATADATVMVILDSRDDVGELVADWGRNTAAGKGVGSMDVARSAASAVCSGYLRAGDRIGFHDLATPSRVIAPMGGTRHLLRLLQAIERSSPSGSSFPRKRTPVVPPGTLIWIFSTFLDDEAARMATLWRAAGHRVIAVDTMPVPDLHGLDRPQRVAHRIVMMERDDRMRGLAAAGAELVPWQVDPVRRAARLLALSTAGVRR